MVRVLYVHGLNSGPKARKALYLQQHFETVTPVIEKPWKIIEAMAIISEQIRDFQPDIVVGSSYGAGLTCLLIQLGQWSGPTLLLSCALGRMAPGRLWLPPGKSPLFIHGTRDTVCPLGPIRRMTREGYGDLITIDDDHRLSSLINDDQLRHWVTLVASTDRKRDGEPMGPLSTLTLVWMIMVIVVTYPFYGIRNWWGD